MKIINEISLNWRNFAVAGHVDFYVNGGALQPECLERDVKSMKHSLKKIFLSFIYSHWFVYFVELIPSLMPLYKRSCSHRLSYKYFAESIANSIDNRCKFTSYPWDGSYVEAQQILINKSNNVTCDDCPEMGINASKFDRQGAYLVFTATKEPYCGKFYFVYYKKLIEVAFYYLMKIEINPL